MLLCQRARTILTSSRNESTSSAPHQFSLRPAKNSKVKVPKLLQVNLDKLLEGDELVLVLVRLEDGSLGNGEKLLRADVGAHHHCQHRKQLLLGICGDRLKLLLSKTRLSYKSYD